MERDGACVLGIDLGTSSLKAAIVDLDGTIRAMGQRGYQFDTPFPGAVEQDPGVWERACVEAVLEALARFDGPAERIKALSLSGQMHGLVALDRDGKSLRPAILHCDARTASQVEEIRAAFAEHQPAGADMNPVFSGFLLPSLLWVRENERAVYDRISQVALPKDYLRLTLTGEVGTDHSDASGTLLYDIERNCWSDQICRAMDIPPALLPPCVESAAPVGTLRERAAEATGLDRRTLVVAGGADQVMQAIGNGAITPGQATVNIGSAGQVCFQSGRPLKNPALNTNTFCASRAGAWYTMGATMSAGLSMKWLASLVGGSDYAALDASAARQPAGSGGLVFLPYLNGERTPHVNPLLSGAFFGLTHGADRGALARAVMEGVGYSLYQCARICEDLGLCADEFIASGGGAQSPVWLGILADIFGKPFKVSARREQAALGAASVAAVGAGFFPSIEEACAAQVRYQGKRWLPRPDAREVYERYYRLYTGLFASCAERLQELTELGRRANRIGAA